MLYFNNMSLKEFCMNDPLVNPSGTKLVKLDRNFDNFCSSTGKTQPIEFDIFLLLIVKSTCQVKKQNPSMIPY